MPSEMIKKRYKLLSICVKIGRLNVTEFIETDKFPIVANTVFCEYHSVISVSFII